MVSVTLRQVLAWRMQRQFLAESAAESATEIVHRLGGVQAQVGSAAELAIAVRQERPEAGDVNRALWGQRSLVKTWAMRGTLHLLPTEDAGAYLALVGAVRSWHSGRHRRRWRR